jgi:DNA-binding IclR family transcriptional regulator
MPSSASSPDPARASTRRVTRETGKFTRSTSGSQSLERGLQILRAFRPGASVLGNAELALRTGLPRPTISRLTRSLVDAGFLSYDAASRGYRLTVVFMSLANAFRYGVPALEVARPLMKKVAEGEKINVGLAVADQQEMVYLESLRESRRGVFRRAVRGSRFPMELTAGGRAYLAGLAPGPREAMLAGIAPRHGSAWAEIRREIDMARADIAARGFCVANWQPGLTGVAAPMIGPDHGLYAINIGFHSTEVEATPLVTRYAPMLLQLVTDVRAAWERKVRSTPI